MDSKKIAVCHCLKCYYAFMTFSHYFYYVATLKKTKQRLRCQNTGFLELLIDGYLEQRTTAVYNGYRLLMTHSQIGCLSLSSVVATNLRLSLLTYRRRSSYIQICRICNRFRTRRIVAIVDVHGRDTFQPAEIPF